MRRFRRSLRRALKLPLSTPPRLGHGKRTRWKRMWLRGSFLSRRTPR